MPISPTYRALRQIALNEFADLVVNARIVALPTGDPLKLRLDIVDGSLLDVFLSVSGRYSYHWDRRMTPAGDLFRHDNAPHHRWRAVSSFPKHLHYGAEGNVVESTLSDDPPTALREFLSFVRQKLLSVP
ncbi:MAG TPA: DUF6516 family protein [Anaerolineae bacterium]|nr:DUF6516 family protein [Anaerolineae bacterium]